MSKRSSFYKSSFYKSSTHKRSTPLFSRWRKLRLPAFSLRFARFWITWQEVPVIIGAISFCTVILFPLLESRPASQRLGLTAYQRAEREAQIRSLRADELPPGALPPGALPPEVRGLREAAPPPRLMPPGYHFPPPPPPHRLPPPAMPQVQGPEFDEIPYGWPDNAYPPAPPRIESR